MQMWSRRAPLGISGVMIVMAVAQAADSPDPARAFVQALAQAPVVQAAQERMIAARHQVGAADRLPDPMVSAGYARRSASGERWPMYDVTFEQPLPRWGARDGQRARARAEVALNEAELAEVVGDIAAELAAMLADADAARARLALLETQRLRTLALQTIINARLAAGSTALAESLAMTSKLATLAVERDTQQRQVEDAEQEVRARLGVAADAPLPPFAAPDQRAVPLERIPGVQVAAAKQADAEALFSEARATRYPETAVGVRYELEQQIDEPMSTVGLEVRISLPIWQGAADQVEAAAMARRRAAQREATAWTNRAQSVIGRAQRAIAVAATARAVAQDTQTRLHAEYDALTRAAATQNGTNLMSVLEVLDRLSEAQRNVIEAEAAARQAEASLWRLAPPDLVHLSFPSDHP